MERAEAREHFVVVEWYEDVDEAQLVLQNYCKPLSAKTSIVRRVMDLQDLWISL